MRTLSRPMFNMGGPIKEGVMHGIREPYRSGTRVGFANGTPPINQSQLIQQIKNWLGKTQGPTQNVGQTTSRTANLLSKAKNIKGIPIGSKFSEQGIMRAIGSMFKKRAPQVFPRLAGFGTTLTAAPVYAYKKVADALQQSLQKQGLAGEGGIYDTSGGWGAMAAGADVPPEVDAIMRGEQIDITGKPLNTLDENLAIKDYGPHTKGPAILTESMREKVTKAAKDRRVNELLKIMGHDQSKKDAVYDALIDASQIVTAAPGGKTLDITKDIISPAIVATSKRFDKPREIEEAVRLMTVKGEIEKDIAAGKGGTLKQNAQDLVNAGVFKTQKAAMDHLAKTQSITEKAITYAGTMKKPYVDQEVVIKTMTDTYDSIPQILVSEDDMEKIKKEDDYKSEIDVFEKLKVKDKLGTGYYVIGTSGFVVDTDGKTKQVL